MKDAGVKIEKVEVSKRLTESPVVVVTSQFGYSAQQEKVMRAQSFQNKDQVNMMSGRKTLEINANHPVIVDLMNKELGVDPDAPLKEVEVPEGEEEEEEAEEEDKDDSDESEDEAEEKGKEEL